MLCLVGIQVDGILRKVVGINRLNILKPSKMR